MTDHEIADLITPMLLQRLEPFGLQRVSVQSEVDPDGGPILSLDVFFEGRGRPVDSQITSSAVTEARRAIASLGEQRFLRLRLHIPDAGNGMAA